MDYRKAAGEEINDKSWVMKHLWNAKRGRKFGLVTTPWKLKVNGIKMLLKILCGLEIRNKYQINGKIYDSLFLNY